VWSHPSAMKNECCSGVLVGASARAGSSEFENMIANHYYSSCCSQESRCPRCRQEGRKEGWLQEGQEDRCQEGWQDRQEGCQEGCQEGRCSQEVRNRSLTKCVRLISFINNLNKHLSCLYLTPVFPLFFLSSLLIISHPYSSSHLSSTQRQCRHRNGMKDLWMMKMKREPHITFLINPCV
jgi:hypothetical protein